MEEPYSKIIKNKITCESICQYMLNALLSGPNPKFNDFIDRTKDDIYSGILLKNSMSHDDIVTEACSKYNNIFASEK